MSLVRVVEIHAFKLLKVILPVFLRFLPWHLTVDILLRDDLTKRDLLADDLRVRFTRITCAGVPSAITVDRVTKSIKLFQLIFRDILILYICFLLVFIVVNEFLEQFLVVLAMLRVTNVRLLRLMVKCEDLLLARHEW